MKFIVVATRKPNEPIETFAPYLDAEADRALELVRDGVFRELYSRTDGQGAIVVIEAADEAEVQSILSTLPMGQAGLLSFEVYGTQAYRGFLRSIA